MKLFIKKSSNSQNEFNQQIYLVSFADSILGQDVVVVVRQGEEAVVLEEIVHDVLELVRVAILKINELAN